VNPNRCFEGTREGVSNKIVDWAKDFKQSPILWLCGHPGTGKSVIAQTVVDQCEAHGLLVLTCFCSRDAVDHEHTCHICSTLAIQLAQKHQKVRSIVAEILYMDGSVLYGTGSSQVEKLIVKPLKAADVPALIVIDGLDECGLPRKSQSDIISALGRWVEEIPKVKFLVTSRPETQIAESFRSPAPQLSSS